MRIRFIALLGGWLLLLTPASWAVDQSVVKTYEYQISSVPPLRIDSLRVFLDGGEAYIIGMVSRIAGYTVDPHDYLAITILSHESRVLKKVRSDYFPKPVRFPNSRLGRQPSIFSVKLDFVPPANSTIQVTYVRLD